MADPKGVAKGGTGTQAEAALCELLAELEADESFLEETVTELRATLPGYELIPVQSVRDSAERNRALSIRTIRSGRPPEPDDVPEAVTLADERAAQGLPIGSMLAGFRVSMSLILRRLLALAPRHGVPAETALEFSTLLWAVGDAFTTRAVVVYRERSIAQEVADSARRSHWIAAAATGALDRESLLAGAATYGVPVDRPVRAVCADRSDALGDWFTHQGPTPAGRVLLAPRGDGVVGILLGDGLEDLPDGAVVALGRPVRLEELDSSFRGATRVLEAAHRVGATGLVDAETLSWRMGVHAAPETTRLLVDRHVAPLLEEGSFGELVLEALGAYLDHGMTIPAAAAAIPVHVNTLRYRLKRYEELTGSSVHRLEDLIEASWALAAHRGADSSLATKDASQS